MLKCSSSRSVLTIVPCGVMALTVVPAHAGGFALEAQSAKAIGAALAGTQAARAEPGFATFNPATIVGVSSTEISFSAIGVITDSEIEDANGLLLGAVPVTGDPAAEGIIDNAIVPSIAISHPLSDRIFLGLNVHAPFGLASRYSDTSIARYHAQDTELTVIAATAILGIEVNDHLSIAAGPRVQYSEFFVSGLSDAAGIVTALGGTGFVPGQDDVPFAIDGDDVAFGYVAGLQATVSPSFRVGFSYTSKMEHDFEGAASFEVENSVAGQFLQGTTGLFQDTTFNSTLNLPAAFQLGAQLDITPDVTLLASTAFTRWSKFENVAAEFDNPAQPDEVLTQDFNDTWSVSGGVEKRFGPDTAVRAGVMYDESPVNDAFASPRIADNDRVWVTAGLSKQLSTRAELHVGGAYIFVKERQYEIAGALPEHAFRGAFSGAFNSSTVLLSAGLDFSF